MSKSRYIYNPNTCSFEKIVKTKWDILLASLRFIFTCFIISVIIYSIHSKFFDSPKEISLKRENETLKSYYNQLQHDISNIQNTLSTLRNNDDNIYRMILDINAMPESIRQAGVGGTNKYLNLENHDKCILETAKRVDKLKSQLYVQSKSYDEIISSLHDKSNMLSCIPAICPIYDKDLIRMTSPFGMRIDPILKVPTMHKGVDYFAPKGTPIYASGDGVVISATIGYNGGWGNKIEIDHGYGYITRYCHQSSFNVRKGDKVKRGQCIGFVGMTGKSTGPHLHYEVLKNRKNVDPLNYILTDITPSEYSGIINLASNNI